MHVQGKTILEPLEIEWGRSLAKCRGHRNTKICKNVRGKF